MLRLMEKFQAHGSLRVSKKCRRKRVRNKSKGKIEVESELIKEPEIAHERVDSVSETGIYPAKSVMEKHSALNSAEREQKSDQEGSLNLSPAVEHDILLQNTEHPHDHSSPLQQDDEDNEKPADREYETSSSSNTEGPATNEVNFNISALVSSFAGNTVVHNLCWLLKQYKVNSVSTNHYIVCMLSRFCNDLELSPMLYQLSLLTIFYDILAEQKTCKSREYLNIINFLTKFVRKMLKMMKSKPLLFVEILFWKTRRDCQFFNAEVLIDSISNLRKDGTNMVGDSTGAFNCYRDMGYRNIADALGEDEIDLDLPSMPHDQREEHSSDSVEGNSDRSNRSQVKKSSAAYTSENEISKGRSKITPSRIQAEGASRRDNPNLTKDQDGIINELYEKYKNERQCSRLIAEALDPDGKISSTFISRKLKHLGLMVIPKKKLVKANEPFPANSDPTISGGAFKATTQHDLNYSENTFSPKISRRKRIRAFSVEEELQIRTLYEKFKSHQKRNVMIANALNPDKKFTPAQVSRKLKQLGLVTHSKSSFMSGKHQEEDGINEVKENSDEETLLAIRERSIGKKRVPGLHATPMSSSPQPKATLQENDSDDLVLSSFFKDTSSTKRKRKPSIEDGDGREEIYSEIRVMNNNTPIKLDGEEHNQISGISASNHDLQIGHSDLEDSIDSGDDMMGPVEPKKIGTRKRMMLHFEEDDED